MLVVCVEMWKVHLQFADCGSSDSHGMGHTCLIFRGEREVFRYFSGGGLPVDFYRQPEAVASWQVGK